MLPHFLIAGAPLTGRSLVPQPLGWVPAGQGAVNTQKGFRWMNRSSLEVEKRQPRQRAIQTKLQRMARAEETWGALGSPWSWAPTRRGSHQASLLGRLHCCLLVPPTLDTGGPRALSLNLFSLPAPSPVSQPAHSSSLAHLLPAPRPASPGASPPTPDTSLQT